VRRRNRHQVLTFDVPTGDVLTWARDVSTNEGARATWPPYATRALWRAMNLIANCADLYLTEGISGASVTKPAPPSEYIPPARRCACATARRRVCDQFNLGRMRWCCCSDIRIISRSALLRISEPKEHEYDARVALVQKSARRTAAQMMRTTEHERRHYPPAGNSRPMGLLTGGVRGGLARRRLPGARPLPVAALDAACGGGRHHQRRHFGMARAPLDRDAQSAPASAKSCEQPNSQESALGP
jgi:hypothetical protein